MCTPAVEEGVTLATGAMGTLSKVSGGDLRRGITTLQSAVRLQVLPLTAHHGSGDMQ